MALVQGLRLGPFRVEAPVGVGAWSEVWTAHTGPKGQIVALQVLTSTLADVPEQAGVFADDTSVATRLIHPSIVRVHALHEEGGRVFRSMAWIDGLDLRRLLSRLIRASRRLPADVAVFIAREIVRALMYAREQRGDEAPDGWAHGRLTPGRVMISRTGKVKVLGFGQLRAVEPSAYAPPAVPAHPTEAADLFAVGVLLWEMLTMRRRFAAEDDWPAIDTRAPREVPPLRAIVPALPAGLETWIDRALSPAPGERTTTLRAMETALTQILSGFAATDPEAAIRALWDELSSAPTPSSDADRTEPNAVVAASDATDPSLGVRPAARPTIEEPPDTMLRRPWVARSPPDVDGVTPVADSSPSTEPLRLPTHSEIVRAVENQVTQPVPAPPLSADTSFAAVESAVEPPVSVAVPLTPTPRDEAIVPIPISGSPDVTSDLEPNGRPAERSAMASSVNAGSRLVVRASPWLGYLPVATTIVAVMIVVLGLLLVLRTI